MKKNIIAGSIVLLAIVISGIIFSIGRQPNIAGALDGFAQCLAQKGFTMYGAYWCPHCQREKAAFGDSFKYIPYVECTEEPGTAQCTAAKITGYPTWITADGRRFEGEQGIEKLSEASSCPLTETNPTSQN
ncbi:MAG: VKORC1/thioredoxin domain protein [Parcubacteria group bacterium GW2011_GWA2_49_9]|nr:MAG: VKORC1/thioredoxin domain protein [Parcubacteria group bacterium GW2011_GWA2_49_9]